MHEDDIRQYFGWFKKQLNNIYAVERREFRKLLTVAMLDALARAYLPKEDKNRVRFTKLVRDLGGWQECERVSLPQLSYRIEKTPSLASSSLAQGVDARLSTWSFGSVIRLNRDAKRDELEQIAQGPDDRRLFSESLHLNLLYEYRNLLVHEFREPGYAMEVTGAEDDQPYYMGMSHPDGRDTWELTYPIAFFKRTARNVIGGLEKKFVGDDANPYAAYDFGSVWVHKKDATPKAGP